MVIDNVFGLGSATKHPDNVEPGFLARLFDNVTRWFARLWCGAHGHLILLHFEPNKLSLQCGLCGYKSEGWEVGQPLARRKTNRAYAHQHRPERRRTLRALPSSARMAS
jgi:hypothetical protein